MSGSAQLRHEDDEHFFLTERDPEKLRALWELDAKIEERFGGAEAAEVEFDEGEE